MRGSDFALLVIFGVFVLGLIIQPVVMVYDGELRFSGSEAYRLLDTIASMYKYRVVGSAADREAAFWIAEKLKALGLETRIDVFQAPSFNGSLVEAFNVYGVKRGSVDAFVVLMAYHDVVPWTIEGTNNNGGGVAVLLELNRVLAGRDTRLGVVFLSTDAEETGLHGAKRFLETFKGRIVAAVSIDMCTWRGT